MIGVEARVHVMYCDGEDIRYHYLKWEAISHACIGYTHEGMVGVEMSVRCMWRSGFDMWR